MTEITLPDLPDGWVHAEHEEVATHGIGDGFVLFAEIGESIRGMCRTFFSTRHGLAVAIELTQVPTAVVYQTDAEGGKSPVTAKIGAMVNLSLTGVDLARKITPVMVDAEIGVQYSHDIVTKTDPMKSFRVWVFARALPA